MKCFGTPFSAGVRDKNALASGNTWERRVGAYVSLEVLGETGVRLTIKSASAPTKVRFARTLGGRLPKVMPKQPEVLLFQATTFLRIQSL